MHSLRAICVLLIFGLLVAGYAGAAVPQAISYQGRLTTNGQQVADGVYSVAFAIYSVSSSGSPLWTEQQSVTTKGGLFTVQLGSVTPFPLDLFEASPRYLGIAISGNPEISPRTQMISVPFALYAGNLAGGPCAACSTVFVNTRGPDALRASADTAFKVIDTAAAARVTLSSRLSAQSSDTVSAIRGVAYNTGLGRVDAGSFISSSNGAGDARGITSRAQNLGSQSAIGVHGSARAQGTGTAAGGWFAADTGGTGPHYGIVTNSLSNTVQTCFGIYGSGINSANGMSIGGSFLATSHSKTYALFANASATSVDTAFAIKGFSDNKGSGSAVGGAFVVDSAGTGGKYGLLTETNGGAGSAYGMWSTATSHSSNAQGIASYGYNTGTDLLSHAYGGFFIGDAQAGSGFGGRFLGYSSTGETYGILATASTRNSSLAAYGVYGLASPSPKSSFAGMSYAGYFENLVHTGTGTLGLYAISTSNSTSSSSYGIYSRSEHQSSGTSYAGYFLADSTGTGTSYGIRPVALTKGTATAYGVHSAVANRSTGNVYAGYFDVLNYGTGIRYAVYGNSPVSGYAGYFNGNVRVTGNQTVVGTKSAAVEVAPEEYRLVYSQESPECWFEDFGEGQLLHGQAHIELDPGFLQTVTIDPQNPMKVFIQLNDPNCNGTAVVRGMTGFDVVELMHGAGSASFSYRVVAKRKGYESVRLARMEGETPAQVAARVDADSKALASDETTMEQNRQQRQLKHVLEEEDTRNR